MEVDRFEDIADEFHKRVSTMVWCNVATVDSRGRPRSRILHPLWEGSVSGAVGWIGTNPASYIKQSIWRAARMSRWRISRMSPSPFTLSASPNG
jgi:hypothetical protein